MADDQRVRITQQFRERVNMAYDLDCAGTRLTVRIFPTETASAETQWRIEARTTDAVDAVVAIASGATRAQALREVAAWWRSKAPTLGLPTFDWEAIALAMAGVKAL